MLKSIAVDTVLNYKIIKETGFISCEWKYIKGFENDYVITSDGDIYSLKYKKPKKLKYSVCSKSKYSKGYYSIKLNLQNKTYTRMVHRLVALHFVDGYFDGAVVNHKDGNSFNNKAENLEWVTQKENLDDANKRNNQTYTKWCYKWELIHPNGIKSPILKGKQEIKNYIESNNLDIKFSMIMKHKHNHGYILNKVS